MDGPPSPCAACALDDDGDELIDVERIRLARKLVHDVRSAARSPLRCLMKFSACPRAQYTSSYKVPASSPGNDVTMKREFSPSAMASAFNSTRHALGHERAWWVNSSNRRSAFGTSSSVRAAPHASTARSLAGSAIARSLTLQEKPKVKSVLGVPSIRSISSGALKWPSPRSTNGRCSSDGDGRARPRRAARSSQSGGRRRAAASAQNRMIDYRRRNRHGHYGREWMQNEAALG